MRLLLLSLLFGAPLTRCALPNAGAAQNNLGMLSRLANAMGVSEWDFSTVTNWFDKVASINEDALVSAFYKYARRAGEPNDQPQCLAFSHGLRQQLTNVTDDCLRDLTVMMCSFENATGSAVAFLKSNDPMEKQVAMASVMDNLWALSIIDSMGKVPWGHYEGHLFWVGDYRECITTQVPERHNLQTKHCTVKMKTLNHPVKQLDKVCQSKSSRLSPAKVEICPQEDTAEKDLVKLHYGICAPQSCSTAELQAVSNVVLHLTRPYLGLCMVQDAVSCDESIDQSVRDDPPAVAFASVLVILASISIFGSFMLVLMRIYNRRKRHESGGGDAVSTSVIDEEADSTSGVYTASRESLPYKQRKVDKIYYSVLKCVSVENNVAFLMDTQVPSSHIACIHGMKVLTIFWIILALTFVYIFSFSENLYVLTRVFDNAKFQVINNATLAGDTYLMITGAIFALLFFRDVEVDRQKTIKSWRYWMKFIFQRITRILPVYMITAKFQSLLFVYSGQAPVMDVPGSDFDPRFCSQNWWTNLLFINNFVRTKQGCLPWTWYTAVEMQLYLFTIPLIVLFVFFPILGLILTLCLIAGSTILNGVAVTDNGLPPSLAFTRDEHYASLLDAYYHYVYIKPYARISAYLIGTLLGYLLYRTRKGVKLPSLVAVALWLGSLALALTVLFGLYDYSKGLPVHPTVIGFYAGCARWAWAVAVALMVFLCHHGYGGLINWLLTLPFYYPMSKLCFSMYLVSPMVIGFFYKQSHYPFHVDSWNLFYYWLGNTIVSLLIAGILFVFIERPIRNIRYFLVGTRHPDPRNSRPHTPPARADGHATEKVELMPTQAKHTAAHLDGASGGTKL